MQRLRLKPGSFGIEKRTRAVIVTAWPDPLLPLPTAMVIEHDRDKERLMTMLLLSLKAKDRQTLIEGLQASLKARRRNGS